MASVKTSVKIGIIAGTGLDDPDILANREEKVVKTPFGDPSDSLVTGEISGIPCVLLARHGRKHTISPTNVNYRANMWALKEEGCTHVLVTTACGSLKEEIRPGDIVILDQFIDRTFKREPSFYDDNPLSPRGICHLQMDLPFCEKTRQVLIKKCADLGLRFHNKGTTVTIEGPRFSTKAESLLFRQWGADIVNMTTVPEACLAKEAGLCYASIALPTDYDSWREAGEPVNVLMVIKTMRENGEKARQLILSAVPAIAELDWTETLKQNKACFKMAAVRRQKGNETVFDKSLPSKSKQEINISTFAFLFSEVVQYNQQRVTSLSQLHEKLADLGRHVGFRMIDLLCWRDRAPKRETRIVNILWFIQKTVWKTLFGKEADRLEQATATEATYYLFEDEPLVNRFVSVPKEQSSFNCAAFMAGIVEGFLCGVQFSCRVKAFLVKEQTTTAFEITFEDSVTERDKRLETSK